MILCSITSSSVRTAQGEGKRTLNTCMHVGQDCNRRNEMIGSPFLLRLIALAIDVLREYVTSFQHQCRFFFF
jgi:hypothetical protein